METTALVDAARRHLVPGRRAAGFPAGRSAVGRVAPAARARARQRAGAVGVYAWDEATGTYLPFALDVLTLKGDRIAEVTAFIVRTTDLPDREAFAHWPEQPLDPRRAEAVFGRAGLPASLSPA